jgi:hypothetical protein
MYAREMTDSADTVTVILRYVIAIQDREFMIALTSDAISFWDDFTGRSLADQLQGEAAEPVIAVQASQKIFLKAQEMAQKEKMEETRTGKFREPAGEAAKDIADMDRLFEDFFWREVNPRLKQPLRNPRR